MSSPPLILVIDDEPDLMLAFLAKALRDHPHRIVVARDAEEGIRFYHQEFPDVVLLDVVLPDRDGLEVFRELQAIDAPRPVIFVTGTSTTNTAIEAMKLGAFDYLFKPLDLEQLQRVTLQALEVSRLMRMPTGQKESNESLDAKSELMIGFCSAMREVYKEVGRVANQDVTVLITGESGTGKELVARAIYQHSKRVHGPFLAINCAAIPEQLLESELFGHEKGAFTGADRRRIGKFEQCNGGTIFLDEVGDMSLLTQAKMLRLLQGQTFERLGGNETIRTDVRLIAATNQPLEKLVRQGKFRADLYYRLGMFTIQLPPLRERGDDIPMLVRHFIQRFNRELQRDIREVSPEAMRLLRQYHWPGNIRELQGVLKQAMLRASGTLLQPDSLPLKLRGEAEPSASETPSASLPASASSSPPVPSPLSASAAFANEVDLRAFIASALASGQTDLYALCVRHMEKLLIPTVMDAVGNSQVKASKLLGITRRTLRNKLRELGLKPPALPPPEEDTNTDASASNASNWVL